jgi:drug/metabolite transporter (DMT)-like permease
MGASQWMRSWPEISVSNWTVAMLLLYGLGMSIGQVLFKLAADRANSAPDDTFLASLFTTGYFYLAVAVYAVLTIVWVWILTRVPLSRAYPFIVVAFLLTPLFGILFFGESLNAWYVVSLGLILCGLGVLVLKAA